MNFSEILIKIQNFSFTKMHLKISSAKWRPFCPGGDEVFLKRGLFNTRVVIWDAAIFLSWKQITTTAAGVCPNRIIASGLTGLDGIYIIYVYSFKRG